MNNSDQEKQNQRTSSGMEDSTAMTIEFLRARLLSERSVSRTARQRADELANRVEELEEQLRIVSLQRMRAEKATADVLAILEGNGISDISETFDSCSDQDTPCESKVGNRSSREEENSINLQVRNNESEEFSGSDLDFSPVPGRSLSWKGRKDSLRSLEKCKDPSLRRRSSFPSVGSSPKRPGKSCRQIRRKESRSVAEEYKASPVKLNSLEDEVATTSEDFPNCSNFEPKIREEKLLLENSHSDCLGNKQNASDNGLDYNVYGGDRDMEKALEHQAQLIGQYEAMEKAQREWEEKFRETNSSSPDSCDPGNHSDITEDRYEIRAPATEPATINAIQTQGLRSVVEDVSKIQPNGSLPSSHVQTNGFLPSSHVQTNGFLPSSHVQTNGFLPSSHVDAIYLDERKRRTTPVSDFSSQDFAFPVANGKQNQDSLGNNYHSNSQRSPGNQSVPSKPSNQSVPSNPLNTSSSCKKGKEASGSENECYAMVPHKASDGLGSVLEALKEAKQSLQQRMDQLPLAATPVGKSVEPSLPNTIPVDKVQIPVGCVGLFRLPTDFSVEGNTRADLSSSARLSLENHYFDRGVPAAASNQFVPSPYLEGRPSSSTGDQYLASQYVGGGSRIPTPRPYFDPYLDTGLPSSSRYSYPNYPINTSYPDLMPRMPNREALLASVPGRTVSMPTSNHYSFDDDNIRPNTYRW